MESGVAERRGNAEHGPRRRWLSRVDGTPPLVGGLSSKVLLLTVLAVMAAEILIYVPSIANFRNNWMEDRLEVAAVTALAASYESGDVPSDLQAKLLERLGVDLIAFRVGGQRRILMSDWPAAPVDRHYDVREVRPFNDIAESFDTLLRGGDRVVRVIGEPPRGISHLEVVLPDRELRSGMIRYSRNILALSLAISAITATLIFLALRRVLIRPMQRISANMVTFSSDPESVRNVIEPSTRRDEIGLAEERLASMERVLQITLRERRRLADLGLAVSKINHDLRNILASAQLFSDRLGSVSDPTVQRLVPKLVSSLDRAIGYAQAVLSYGKASEAQPERNVFPLRPLVEEVSDSLAIRARGTIEWTNDIDPGVEIDADRDQLFRVIMNVLRNALEILEVHPGEKRIWAEAKREGAVTKLCVCDSGPGVPARARDHLFEAFRGSARPGGTGLGLAIASEIVRAHGGSISLDEDGAPGACFEITIPDRPASLEEARRQRVA